jgi:hypothetical protein
MNVVRRHCDLLAQSAEGRAALTTAAAADDDPLLRLMSATTIQRWDADGARAVLEDLVRLAGGTVVRPMTMTDALAVKHGSGRDAALCLLNIDHPNPPVKATPPTVSKVPVASGLLDAAERVHSLTMNGGIDHAYEVVGEQFAAAAEALDAIGAGEGARVLREVLALLDDGHDATGAGRATALAALNPAQDEALQALDAQFQALDDLMERLEVAVEV